jgi:hypothetical protein
MDHERAYWPFLGTLAAAILWGVSAFANFHAGYALSEDDTVKAFLGSASVGSDLMKVALLFAMCAAWRASRPIIAALSLVLFLVMSLWSLRAGGVFIADALTAHSAKLAHARRIEENSDALMQLRQQRAGFLSGQQIRPDSQMRKVREAALAENKRVADEFSTLTRQIEGDIEEAKSTPPSKGESFSQLLQEFLPVVPSGASGERMILLATAAFFALLLELGSSFGPLVLAQARAPRARRVAPSKEPERPSEAVQALQAIQAAVATLPPPEPVPEPVEEPQLPAVPTSNVVDLSGRPLAVGQSASLEDALALLFEPAPGQRLLLADVVSAVNANIPRHRRLTSPRKITEVLVPALEATDWGIEKVKVGGRIYIVGVRARHIPRARRKS